MDLWFTRTTQQKTKHIIPVCPRRWPAPRLRPAASSWCAACSQTAPTCTRAPAACACDGGLHRARVCGLGLLPAGGLPTPRVDSLVVRACRTTPLRYILVKFRDKEVTFNILISLNITPMESQLVALTLAQLLPSSRTSWSLPNNSGWKQPNI